ncbi:hypothetical protein V9K67_01695 [Paraflavisolibacter sp. H34]|uniref:hypothetical protein n=1 Tax=Huijunlia imazamoxiresistens TaxID=3127457 RepID=UPI00301B1435
MEANHVNPELNDQQANASPEGTPGREPAANPDNQQGKRKRRKVSALVAASMYRSPVGRVSSTSYGTNNFDNMGTNISYHEEGGIG